MVRQLVVRWLEGVLSRSMNSQKALEERDLYGLYLRTTHRQCLLEHGRERALAQHQAKVDELARHPPAKAKLASTVQALVHAQVKDVMGSLHAAGVGAYVDTATALPTTPPSDAGLSLNERLKQQDQRRRAWLEGFVSFQEKCAAHTRAVVSAEPSESERKVQGALGYFLRRAPSTIPFGGDGLYVVGSVPIGSVVALYPGTVFHPWDATRLPGGIRFFDNNAYLFARFDSIFVDGCNPPSELAGPLGLGHLINHPAKGQHPNVMPFTYDVPSDVPEHLRHYIPNRYYSEPPLGREVFMMKTLAMVTTRDVENEELLVNYRMNPKMKYPMWYFPVDGDEDRMRWTK